LKAGPTRAEELNFKLQPVPFTLPYHYTFEKMLGVDAFGMIAAVLPTMAPTRPAITALETTSSFTFKNCGTFPSAVPSGPSLADPGATQLAAAIIGAVFRDLSVNPYQWYANPNIKVGAQLVTCINQEGSVAAGLTTPDPGAANIAMASWDGPQVKFDMSKIFRKDDLDVSKRNIFTHTVELRLKILNNAQLPSVNGTTQYKSADAFGAKVTFLLIQEDPTLGPIVVGVTQTVGSISTETISANINPSLPLYLTWEAFQDGNTAGFIEAITFSDFVCTYTTTGTTSKIRNFRYFDGTTYQRGSATTIRSYAGAIRKGPAEIGGAELVNLLNSIISSFIPPDFKTIAYRYQGTNMKLENGTLPFQVMTDLTFAFTNPDITTSDFDTLVLYIMIAQMMAWSEVSRPNLK
jgi:hypothetical protein